MNPMPTEAWWTPWQEAIVEDRSRRWELQRFQPSDAILFPDATGAVMRQKIPDESTPPKSQLVSGGWEHEHCALCWQKISEQRSDEGAGYSDGRDWLCTTCYEKFVVPRLSKG